MLGKFLGILKTLFSKRVLTIPKNFPICVLILVWWEDEGMMDYLRDGEPLHFVFPIDGDCLNARTACCAVMG